MRVKAIKAGWDGRMRRREGEVFDFDGPLGKWMVEVGPGAVSEQDPEQDPEQVSLGQLQVAQKARAEIIKRLGELGVPFFKGDPTEKLQALLDQQEGDGQ